jgi:hypothetical protein
MFLLGRSRRLVPSLESASIALALVVLLTACDDLDSDAAETDEANAGCSADPRASDYETGMSATGSMLTVELADASPAPPSKRDNTWTITVRDEAGDPLDGADVWVTTWMPDHGHGGTVDPTVVAGGGPGGYVVDPVHLQMAGLWEVTIHAIPEGASEEDSVTFGFCVES